MPKKMHGSGIGLFSNASDVIKLIPASLRNIPNLWDLNPEQRVLFIQKLLHDVSSDNTKNLQKRINEYEQLCGKRADIARQAEVDLLKQMDVVGITATGASIHQKMLAELRPKVIIVEEAAEVLETNIIALLGPWVDHLILIGDHKQLRPQVETYELVKKYKFDVSMMERLINNGHPYAVLQRQNRMREEFVYLLKDIYPDLLSNLDRVRLNEAPMYVEKSMFFWDHDNVEQSDFWGTGYVNHKEAEMVIDLACFLINQEYSPRQVTILAAYQGQTRLLRKMMKDERKVKEEKSESKDVERPRVTTTKNLDDDDIGIDEQVTIHTIDNYQGDENDVVIVSLVRSNKEGNVGFLKTLNRRCVSQSRAKCGMYFVGNKDTLQGCKHWTTMISKMSETGCVGRELTLLCEYHKGYNLKARGPGSIPRHDFCYLPCVHKMDCGKHACPLRCHPRHSHIKCSTVVKFKHTCDHDAEAPCWEKESGKYKCNKICMKINDCGLHACKAVCGEQSTSIHRHGSLAFRSSELGASTNEVKHKHQACQDRITFLHPVCRKHEMEEECEKVQSDILWKNILNTLKGAVCESVSHKDAQKTELKCKVYVLYTFPECKHQVAIPCHTDVTQLKCHQHVEFTQDVCKHVNLKECHMDQKLVRCETMVPFVFDRCGHESKKKCYEPEHLYVCKIKVTRVCLHCSKKTIMECNMSYEKHYCMQSVQYVFPNCRHEITKKCFEVMQHKAAMSELKLKSEVVQPCQTNSSKKLILKCEVEVVFLHSVCKHKDTKKCYVDPSSVLCKKMLKLKLPCGHESEHLCSQAEDFNTGKCTQPCLRILPCGHPCKLLCFKACDPSKCTAQSTYACARCQHVYNCECKEVSKYKNGVNRCKNSIEFIRKPCLHKGKRLCFEREDDRPCEIKTMTVLPCSHEAIVICVDIKCNNLPVCEAQVDFFRESCGHRGRRACSKTESDVRCEATCGQVLQCGCPCKKKCYENCQATCQQCIKLETKIRKKRQKKSEREWIRQKQRELEEEMKALPVDDTQVIIIDINDKSDTAREYYNVYDLANTFIISGNNWFQNITKIQKIVNVSLRKDWLKTRRSLHDPVAEPVLRCCFTTKEKADDVAHSGWGKYLTHGSGLHFTSNSFMASSGKGEVSQHNVIVVCSVLIGKTQTVKEAGRNRDFDSVYIRHQPSATNKEKIHPCDEYIVYRPEQILPAYLVHYDIVKLNESDTNPYQLQLAAMRDNAFKMYVIKPSRTVNLQDNKEIHYRIAESQFLRLQKREYEITGVTYYINPELVRKFEDTETRFRQKYGDSDSSQVLAFHGTNDQNIESIMKENFRMDKMKRALHGPGIYFSEFPDISIGYGSGLVLSKVLPGKTFDGSTKPEGFDSNRVRGDIHGRGEMLVIYNPDQILPCYVINYKRKSVYT